MSAQSEILVNIRAVDKATREMKAVKAEVGLLGDSIKGLGVSSVLGYTSAGVALGAFVKGGLREFSQMEKANAQLNATLASTGGVAGVTAEHADRLSSSLMKMSSVDDEVVKSAEAVMLTFTNVRNTGLDHTFDDAMTAALDLSQVFGQDLQSSVVQVGKALQDPIAGVTALRRVGVQLSDAQEEQIRQFMAVNDVASAQKVILGELQREVGGSAKAFGETMPGKIALAEQEFSNLEGQIVGHVVPAMVSVVGIAGDTAVAIGKASDAVEDSVGKIGDAWDLLPGPIQDATVKTMQFAAVLSLPVLAVGAAGIKGIAMAVDEVSDSEDELATKTTILSTMGSYIRAVTQDTDEWSRAIDESSRRLGTAPQAAMGIRDSLQGLTDDAYAAKDAADKARQAFYDLLHQPSQERQQREAGLAQAEFNVGMLEQKRAKGPLSPDNEAWYQWLVNTFIPAQQQWLKLDELRVNRDDKNATLAERLTGDYRDMNQVQQGTIGNLTNITDGTYDVNDAMQGLAALPPANLKVNLDGPKTDPSKIKPDLKAYINNVNDWLKQFPFNWGFDEPPFPPRQMTKNEARAFIKDVNDFLKDLPFNWHVPDPKFPDEEPTKEDAREFVKNVNNFFKNLPFHWHIPDPDQPTAEDITPDLRTTITNVNAFFDKTPFNWHIPTPWAPSDDSLKGQASYIISRIRYWWSVLTSPFGGGAGMTFTPTDLQAAQALYGQIAATITRPHNEQGVAMPTFFTGSGGSTFMVGPVVLNGIDIASPTGAAKFVDAIWPTLRERMRQG